MSKNQLACRKDSFMSIYLQVQRLFKFLPRPLECSEMVPCVQSSCWTGQSTSSTSMTPKAPPSISVVKEPKLAQPKNLKWGLESFVSLPEHPVTSSHLQILDSLLIWQLHLHSYLYFFVILNVQLFVHNLRFKHLHHSIMPLDKQKPLFSLCKAPMLQEKSNCCP